MKKILSCYLLILLIITACNKKEYPKDSIESSEASFFSGLLINGTPLSLEAGKNGYYMYSSYQQDSNGVYGFIGELKLSNGGNNSPNSLKIQINDSKVSAPNDPSNINASLIPGNYNYFEAGYKTLYGIEFESAYNKNPKSYLWDFGDGKTSTVANPIHYFKSPGTHNACLNIEGTNTCNSSACNDINIGNNSFNAFVNLSNQSGNTVYLSATAIGGRAPFKHFWSFGDDSTSILPNPIHKYAITGSYPVTLILTDADLKTTHVSYNVVTGGDLSSCASNFKIKSILPSINNLGLSEVIVSFTDASGITYTSNLRAQTTANSFKIISVEDFENNEKGEKTKKIRFNFKCQLYAGTQTMTIENTEGVFCVSYK